MSEDMFLIIFGLSFGVPLIIGVVFFAIAMNQHDKDMDESAREIEEIKNRREARERLK